MGFEPVNAEGKFGDYVISTRTSEPVTQESLEEGISGISEVKLSVNEEFLREGGWVPCKVEAEFVDREKVTLTEFDAPFLKSLTLTTGDAHELANALEYAAGELRRQYSENAKLIGQVSSSEIN
ncbi:hypothetical protein [Halalkalibacter urbisdiaboli]|uniref:hypothetical protein n=1 Tax=Halalkalibacter urbisdiaboli TaxID=1960589 RepID=UPI000B44B5FC|nr:hypothetical protein [Halalkalibacter urbisdiaboli]